MAQAQGLVKGLPSNTVQTLKRVFSVEFFKEHKIPVILLILLCLYPIGPAAIGMDYLVHIAVVANIMAVIAIAWDINGGYTGQGNLAPAFFAGITGYTSAILTTQAGWPPVLGILLGVFFSFLSAVAIGIPSLRLTGPYLLIVTFCVAEVARKLTIYYSDITRGEEGIGNIPRIFDGTFVNFYFTLIVLIIVYLVSRKIIQSKWGLAFKAIAADETRAKTLGVDLMRYKVLSFSVCGIIAGFAGGIYAHYQAHIDPNFFSIIMAITIISMAVVGGEKTLIGPILGAYLLQFSSEGLRFVTGGAPWVRLGIHGLLLVVVMLFLPGGILSLFRKESGDESKTVSKRVQGFLHGIFFVDSKETPVAEGESTTEIENKNG